VGLRQHIQQHGLDSPIFAAMRADSLLEQSDLEGARTWRLIVNRINALLVVPAGPSN
jgi:hypothetical protein